MRYYQVKGKWYNGDTYMVFGNAKGISHSLSQRLDVITVTSIKTITEAQSRELYHNNKAQFSYR